jgi:hypothetical protein
LREATRERQWSQFQYPGTEWLPSGAEQQHESAEGQDCERGRYVGKACLADQRPEGTSGIDEAGYQQSAPVNQDRDKAECQKHCHYGNSRFGFESRANVEHATNERVYDERRSKQM